MQAARTALARGWFAGWVLSVDMLGYDPARRVDPDRAVEGFLRAMAVPGEHIPTGPHDRLALYRSVLEGYAAAGRPVLVVVDNVSTKDQATPLLPAHPACRAIVTSRERLGRLGARLLDLDILDEPEAAALLDHALRVARAGDRRITATSTRPGSWPGCAAGSRSPSRACPADHESQSRVAMSRIWER